MAHVFISYKHDGIDKDFAKLVCQQLQITGLETWIDDDISPGVNWSRAIDEAIKASFALIVIITPKSKLSEFVTYEWSFALGNGVPVIPLLLEATDLHPKLSELQYVDYTHITKQQLGWERLVSRLKEIKDIPPSRSPVPEDEAASDLEIFFRDLESSDRGERRKAAILLGEMGHSSAVPHLVKALDDEAWTVRAEAAAALGEIGDKKAVMPLLKALRNSTSTMTKLNIAWALGEIRDERAFASLLEFAKFGKDKRIRLISVKALGKLRSSQSIAELVKIAKSNHSYLEVRIAAIQELGIPNDEGVAEELYELLDDNNVQVQEAAASALVKVGTGHALNALKIWEMKRQGFGIIERPENSP